jgi:hypothetical protein
MLAGPQPARGTKEHRITASAAPGANFRTRHSRKAKNATREFAWKFTWEFGFPRGGKTGKIDRAMFD